jgi:hypothetical protein
MRKQYQWVVLIVFAAVFCCTYQDNNPKACGTNATACTAVNEKIVNTAKHIKKIEAEYATEENNPVYLFADPYIYSN